MYVLRIFFSVSGPDVTCHRLFGLAHRCTATILSAFLDNTVQWILEHQAKKSEYRNIITFICGVGNKSVSDSTLGYSLWALTNKHSTW